MFLDTLIFEHVFTIKKSFTLLKKSIILPHQQAGLLINEVGPPAEEVHYGLPLRLVISKINTSSSIESVGLTTQGAMDVPKLIENVAWFKLGVHPGEIGSAVISGHYGWKNKKVSAFDKLHLLKKGDVILVEDENGVVISFVVSEIKIYAWQADSKEVFISSDGKSHLNLIACAGKWDKVAQTYSDRLVVFTDKVLQ